MTSTALAEVCALPSAVLVLSLHPVMTYPLRWRPCCRYMLEVLPLTDWSQTAVRPALNLILRRLERMFSKIYKKSTLRVSNTAVGWCWQNSAYVNGGLEVDCRVEINFAEYVQCTFDYYAPPHMVGHYAMMTIVRLSVCLSVCPVPDPKSRTEGRSKLKISRREAHDVGDPWPI